MDPKKVAVSLPDLVEMGYKEACADIIRTIQFVDKDMQVTFKNRDGEASEANLLIAHTLNRHTTHLAAAILGLSERFSATIAEDHTITMSLSKG